MKRRNVLHLLALLLVFLTPQTIVKGALENRPNAPDAWSVVAPGIEYQKYHLSISGRPVNIFVTRMDRSYTGVTIESSIAQGKLSGGTETVGGMASRYDQAINYWGETWGNRNRVVVAINGYFFGPQDEPYGVPWSGVVQSGWYAKRFTETRGDAGFTWTLDRQAFIGKCVSHPAEKNDVTFPNAASYNPNIDAVNVARSDEQLILYTPQFDATTALEGSTPRAEILVELSRPALLISDPLNVQGTIRGIRKNNGSTPIPFDHVVLAAWGSVGDAIVSRINSDDIQVGDPVRITQEIRDCPVEPVQHDWSKAYASLGGDYHFLRSRTYYAPNNPDATVRNSRTAIAYNAAYVYFIVVDAFDPGVSVGITISDLSSFLRNSLSATDAVSLDSGTSSTMVVNGQIVNNTYCNYTRQCGTQSGSVATGQPSSGSSIEWNSAADQANVGSGMMMVVVEQQARSDALAPAQIVTTTDQTSLRLGPGTNYATLTTLASGVQGIVQSHGLDGVLAKGSCWWKVAFGGNVGWVKQESLRGQEIPPPPRTPGDFSSFLPFLSTTQSYQPACGG